MLAMREVGACELLEDCLARIDARDGAIGAFLTLDRAGARAAALASERRRAAGEVTSLLDGVPIALVDNLCVASLPMTVASRMLRDHVPLYDAHVVARLRRTGAVIVGKTNLDEMAIGASGTSSALGRTVNPHDPGRVPGGASSGSAAALAAGLVSLALGSDTGGSVRVPAALTGVVGLRPTYGRVSRAGLAAHAPSLDQVGPMARDVRDCALLLGAIAGYDPRDAQSRPVDVPDFSSGLELGAAGLRLGVPAEAWAMDLEPAVLVAAEAALAILADDGAAIEDVALPSLAWASACYLVIAAAEASSSLARYDGVTLGVRADLHDARYAALAAGSRAAGFGPGVVRRLLLGTHALLGTDPGASYRVASVARARLVQDHARVLEDVDVLVMPTVCRVAWPVSDAADVAWDTQDVEALSVGASLAGLPAISVPCGLTADGLPIGLTLVGRPFEEATILRAARALERRLSLAGRVAPERTP